MQKLLLLSLALTNFKGPNIVASVASVAEAALVEVAPPASTNAEEVPY